MLELRVSRGSRITGDILRNMLREAGLMEGAAKGLICYGAGGASNLPTLNAAAGRQNKYEELQLLRAAGVIVPRTWLAREYTAVQRPVLARRFNHQAGTDIWLLRTEAGVRRFSQRRDFFVQYIPSDTEYRVFVYRNRHLRSYEKILAHPEQKRSVVSRNHRHGFAFQICAEERIPRGAVEQARQAIAALNLDFGAVDVLHGKDGRYYVLEVNTAPGAESENMEWIQALVHRFERWAKNGFPTRGREEQ